MKNTLQHLSPNAVNEEKLIKALQQEKTSHEDHVVLPLPPKDPEHSRFEMDVYARFMRHLRHVPHSRLAIKVLTSIQFVADMMDLNDALIAKTLVDMGLRGPRRSFPLSFLDFADKSVTRSRWDIATTPVSVEMLKDHWHKIGEDRFASVTSSDYATFNQNAYIRA